MSSTASLHEPAVPAMAPSLVLLMAVGAGLAAASIYYCQPMVAVLASQFQAPASAVGLVPTLTQLGFAMGILLLAPLGDRFDRRKIILGKAAVLCAALLVAAAAPSLPVLLASSLVIGLMATMAQDILPAAATLAPVAHRGKTVGTVMTGLLMGILLSRVVSGFVAEHFGWRTMFIAAAVGIALLGVALWRGLPRFSPTTQLPYGALLASTLGLLKTYPALRRAALAQGVLSVSFGAFWSTLAVMLHANFQLGSSAAGAFGLAGAAGALMAPLAGRAADRRGPEVVIRIGTALVAGAFVAMACGPGQLWLVAAGAVMFDLGIQMALISHQSIVYGIDPAARSRLNAVLMTSMFIGMSSGAFLGSVMLGHFGWLGVCGISALAGLLALGVRLWPANGVTQPVAG